VKLHRTSPGLVAAVLALLTGCGGVPEADSVDEKIQATAESLGVGGVIDRIIDRLFPPGYNVHLGLYDAKNQNFEPLQPGADVDRGRALFGIAEDLETEDASGALFEGFSVVAQREIESNGRSCFTCHRGLSVNLGMPLPPLSDTISLDDPLFTGIDGDAQGDPDGFHNLDILALMKYRPNRFNQARDPEDPFSQVFFWRKSIALVNVAFTHGFLNDGRGRSMLETDRGAIFSHTQEDDDRFDDLFTFQQLEDLTAFQFSVVSDERLLALRDPSDPMHETLMNDPFYTVDVQTAAQERGKKVFERNCMSCHNAPNVFNNAAGVEPLGTNGLAPSNPVPAPSVGRTFNVGVSEWNRHGLRFTRDLGDGSFEPIVLPLANEDGSINMHTVETDIGLAATTGRTADIGRFKVPQLRNIRNLAPYFHDNSAFTLEEVIEYFNSPQYNDSTDGRRHPVRMNEDEKADLLEFLLVL
jgi:hypothetical protein